MRTSHCRLQCKISRSHSLIAFSTKPNTGGNWDNKIIGSLGYVIRKVLCTVCRTDILNSR